MVERGFADGAVRRTENGIRLQMRARPGVVAVVGRADAASLRSTPGVPHAGSMATLRRPHLGRGGDQPDRAGRARSSRPSSRSACCARSWRRSSHCRAEVVRPRIAALLRRGLGRRRGRRRRTQARGAGERARWPCSARPCARPAQHGDDDERPASRRPAASRSTAARRSSCACSRRPAARPSGAVLIGGAMGVRQAFYRPFAQWLADQGYVVATFDYRGVGDSRGRAACAASTPTCSPGRATPTRRSTRSCAPRRRPAALRHRPQPGRAAAGAAAQPRPHRRPGVDRRRQRLLARQRAAAEAHRCSISGTCWCRWRPRCSATSRARG